MYMLLQLLSRLVMSDSVRPHRRPPTRFLCPWDSPGKNIEVGCHFLLQCMKVKSESEVTQSCPTLSNPMDCSLPASSIRAIFQARVLEWGAIAFSIYVHTQSNSGIMFLTTNSFLSQIFNSQRQPLYILFFLLFTLIILHRYLYYYFLTFWFCVLSIIPGDFL